MAENLPIIAEIRNLSVEFHTRYGIVQAVRDVSWRITAGETLAILGESGSGKSVTAAAFMGLIDSPPGHITQGEIFFEGADLLSAPAETRRQINGRKAAMIFQDTLAALNPVYPIGWQVAEAFRAHGMPSAEARQRAFALLERVGIPEARRRIDDYPHQFSGGQRQRIMIAMAIAWRPVLLIADEPTTALDVTIQAEILKLLKELQLETGMGLLLITHDIGIVSEVADRICVMKDGQIVETGTVDEILDAPKHPYTQKLIAAMPGGKTLAAPGNLPAGEVLLSVDNLSKHYQIVSGLLRRNTGAVAKALDGISFDIRRGETVGVVGESGSGKSTLVRTILGLEEPTGGDIFYAGKSTINVDAAEFLRLRRKIQVVFQDPSASLHPLMSVGDIISEPWVIHPGVVKPSDYRERVAELLTQVGLQPEHARRYPHQFSGGQRQRIAFARALALRPELIICDEAVSALDVSVQAQIIQLLKKLQDEYGLSYLFVAHDLPVVHDFADRVIVMNNGKIVEQGTTASIFNAPSHPYTQKLLASDPASRRLRTAAAKAADCFLI